MLKDKYEISDVAIDAVIFAIIEDKLCVFAAKREKDPFKEKFELVGGLLKHNETAEETLKRKVIEQTGQSTMFFTQFHTFTKVDRDPRARVISIGYVALINLNRPADKDLDKWHQVNSLPEMAFDHKEIITNAYSYLKENLDTRIIRSLMPKKFPLNDLQKIYEIIEGKKYDNRNFRRQMIDQGIVLETKEILTGCSHRPPKLYILKG